MKPEHRTYAGNETVSTGWDERAQREWEGQHHIHMQGRYNNKKDGTVDT